MGPLRLIGFRLGVAAVSGLALLAIGTAGKLTAGGAEPSSLQAAARNCSSAKPCMRVTNNGTGSAIAATSTALVGVSGTTKNPSVTDGYGTTGVLGVDAATDGGQQNIGVQGISGTSNGVEGITNNPSKTSPFGRAAVFGIDASTDGGRRNWGTAGYSTAGTGILGISSAVPQASGEPFAAALLAVCENGGPSIEAADGPLPSSNLFLLADCAGNLTIKGTVTTGSPPLIATKRNDGTNVGAYASREAEPTIEDVGRAQLVAGKADVALSTDFASTIERNAAYIVLITAEGDSRGLYVAKKTPEVFEVRESQGGRSSISFSYRIVARALGDREARLPLISTALGRSAPRAPHQTHSARDIIRGIGGPVPPGAL
jgi:hypothetical protein